MKPSPSKDRMCESTNSHLRPLCEGSQISELNYLHAELVHRKGDDNVTRIVVRDRPRGPRGLGSFSVRSTWTMASGLK